jgi:hypothetical protein
LDYKLRARNESAIMYESIKIEKKKARKVLLEKPLVVGGYSSSKH